MCRQALGSWPRILGVCGQMVDGTRVCLTARTIDGLQWVSQRDVAHQRLESSPRQGCHVAQQGPSPSPRRRASRGQRGDPPIESTTRCAEGVTAQGTTEDVHLNKPWLYVGTDPHPPRTGVPLSGRACRPSVPGEMCHSVGIGP